MPFDGNEADIKIELYKARREGAIEIWNNVPPERFDITDFFSHCGTIGCALGWLAFKNYDGWHNNNRIAVQGSSYSYPPIYEDALASASLYFGITIDQADKCFGTWHTCKIYKKQAKYVTAQDVAKLLSEMPFTIFD